MNIWGEDKVEFICKECLITQLEYKEFKSKEGTVYPYRTITLFDGVRTYDLTLDKDCPVDGFVPNKKYRVGVKINNGKVKVSSLALYKE